MIDFRNVSVGFGAQQVLDDVTFRINRGERVGIVGPNGAGKSTIFSLLMDEYSPDHGDVSLPRGIRVSHLRQQLRPASPEVNLLEYSENALPALIHIQREIEALEAGLDAADEALQGLLDLHPPVAPAQVLAAVRLLAPLQGPSEAMELGLAVLQSAGADLSLIHI